MNCNIIILVSVSSDAAAAAAAGRLSTDVIGCTSVGVRAGYARGKARVTKHRSSAALLIQTFCGHADCGLDECGPLEIDAGR